MVAAALVTPTLMDKMATSSNPWIYLVVILIGGISFIAKRIYSDMKKEKKETAEATIAREERLIKIDEQNRIDSREEKLMLMKHLKSTVDALNKNTDVIHDLSRSVEKVSISQDLMQQTQQETVEAVRNLNTDFREMKSWVAEIDKKVNEKESA